MKDLTSQYRMHVFAYLVRVYSREFEQQQMLEYNCGIGTNILFTNRLFWNTGLKFKSSK